MPHDRDADRDELKHERIPADSHGRDPADDPVPNPPHTTTGKITAPKFGSAGSGGAELEPGPERD